MVLGRMFEPREVKKKGLMQAIILSHGRFGRLALAGKKPFMLQTVMNDADAIARKAEEFQNILSRVLTDRNNLVLPVGQTAGHYPPVYHSFPIIFPSDMKGRQV